MLSSVVVEVDAADTANADTDDDDNEGEDDEILWKNTGGRVLPLEAKGDEAMMVSTRFASLCASSAFSRIFLICMLVLLLLLSLLE